MKIQAAIIAALLTSFVANAAERVEVRVSADTKANVFGKISLLAETSSGATCLTYDSKRKLLYVGGDHSVMVYDAALPQQPKLLGQVKGVGKPRQMVSQDGIVYVASRETGLWIIDATRPTAPKIVSRFDSVELATGIDVCYPVVFLGQRHYGVEFIDVSDLAHPQHIRTEKTGESQSVVYRDGIVYSGDWGVGEVTTIDAHDMSCVKTLNIASLKGHGDGVDVQGNLLFASTGHHYHDKTRSKAENLGRGHGMEIYDISNPKLPRFVSRVQFPKFYSLGNDFWTPRASGNTVFCSDTFNGVFAVDISDSLKPKVIGRVQAFTPDKPLKDHDGNIIDSTPFQDIALGEGVIYAAVPRGGAYVIVSKLASPSTRKRGQPPMNESFRMKYNAKSVHFKTWAPPSGTQVRGVAVYKDFVYAACTLGGLIVLNKDVNGQLIQVGRVNRSFVGDVKVRGNRLYAAEGADGIGVYDLTNNPTNPTEVGRCNKFKTKLNYAVWVWVPADDLIVCSDRESGYVFLDARDITNMKVTLKSSGCPGWERYLSDKVIGGKWVAQSMANIGFKWIDVSNSQAKISHYSRKNVGGLADGCCAFKGDRLLRMMNGGIVYLKPGQLENVDGSVWGPSISIKGNKGTMNGGQPVWNGGNLLALTKRTAKEVALVDISDELSPKLLWKESVAGYPESSCWWQETLLVPCGHQGLLYTY